MARPEIQRRFNKGMSTLAACALAVTASVTAAGGAVVYHHGLIRVHVNEKRPGGDRVNIIVPGAVVPVVLALVPDRQISKAEEKLRQVLPALAIAAGELERYPDAVFVEVKEKREYVRVATEGGNLTVYVDSPGENVRVSVPLATLQSVTRTIAARGPAQ